MKIGVDVGGTTISAGLVLNGEVIKSISKPCPAQSSEEETIIYLKDIISEIINNSVKGIGVGVPSVVDAEAGIVYNAANIPSWKKVYLKDHIQNKFQIPTYINNDANCFVLGEKTHGEAKGFANIIGITLGTGVGAGIVIDNKLYNGSNTGAGEIGGLPYLDSDYEHYCSSLFFAKYYKLTAKELFERASLKEQDTLNIWKKFGTHIGKLILATLYTYDPQVVVLGGSIAAAFPFFSQSMYQSMSSFPYPQIVEKLQIKISKNKNTSILGASSLIR